MAGGKWRLGFTRERLMANVRKLPNGCWEWAGFVNPLGYGATSYNGRRGFLAHRAMSHTTRGYSRGTASGADIAVAVASASGGVVAEEEA